MLVVMLLFSFLEVIMSGSFSKLLLFSRSVAIIYAVLLINIICCFVLFLASVFFFIYQFFVFSRCFCLNLCCTAAVFTFTVLSYHVLFQNHKMKTSFLRKNLRSFWDDFITAGLRYLLEQITFL